MPTARSTATAMNSPSTAQSRPVPISPSRKAGITTWSVAQPSTHASATVITPNSRLPIVDRVKINGSRRMATPSTANPSRVVDPR